MFYPTAAVVHIPRTPSVLQLPYYYYPAAVAFPSKSAAARSALPPQAPPHLADATSHFTHGMSVSTLRLAGDARDPPVKRHFQLNVYLASTCAFVGDSTPRSCAARRYMDELLFCACNSEDPRLERVSELLEQGAQPASHTNECAPPPPLHWHSLSTIY